MKLDTKSLRYFTSEDWRVLTAVEIGSKNHEIVPNSLIVQVSGLRASGAVHKSISTLAKANLIARGKNMKYEGYRLTSHGLDHLALHTHLKRNVLYSTSAHRIGTGKESDIHACMSSSGNQLCLKIHRLGRISFRSVKNNRDYLRHRSSASWLYMSRLAALKEYTILKALSKHGFSVPTPVTHNRHTVVMELVQALPLRQIKNVPDPAGLYAELVEMVIRLAEVGLIHGDFNEFNILIREDEVSQNIDRALPESQASSNPDGSLSSTKLTPILIDFPQTLSVDHPNAEMYFDRDIACLKSFFMRRFHFVSDATGPHLIDARNRATKQKGKGTQRLDVEVEASGFSKKMAKDLDSYLHEVELRRDEDENGAESTEAGEQSPSDSDETNEVDAIVDHASVAVKGGFKLSDNT